jgi:hypothetical protein
MKPPVIFSVHVMDHVSGLFEQLGPVITPVYIYHIPETLEVPF